MLPVLAFCVRLCYPAANCCVWCLAWLIPWHALISSSVSSELCLSLPARNNDDSPPSLNSNPDAVRACWCLSCSWLITQDRYSESSQQTQNICITFVQCWTNVETLYKCYANVLCLLGYDHTELTGAKLPPALPWSARAVPASTGSVPASAGTKWQGKDRTDSAKWLHQQSSAYLFDKCDDEYIMMSGVQPKPS